MEAVAASTVFTTHTAVPAGHDHFSDEMMLRYFDGYCRETGVNPQALLALGRTPQSADFNMTALAVRGSRYHNGVSRIHCGVSERMLRELWPQVPAEENPVEYVTNGVHVPTFLSPEWAGIFDRFLGANWTEHLTDCGYWQRIHSVPDHIFWSVRQYLKSQMLHLVRYRLRRQLTRNRSSESHLDRLFRLADPDSPNVLTIGFARRFATYKRATLLFEDLDRLKRIICDRERPVLFVFAGKAHPADTPGQDAMRNIIQVARMPEFEGRILLVEGYDLRLARRLVSGVDVWLNNPVYPLEASGTSGMKGAMNGVINLSVLDGWWGEGYQADNGWAIKPAAEQLDQATRNREEARTLYELLQDQVIPLYYARGTIGHSPGWVKMAKQSLATLLPRFNATRMLGEYVSKFYRPADTVGRRYQSDGYEIARTVARWKERVRAAWGGVTIRRTDEPRRRIAYGERVQLVVSMRLNGLSADDVAVELLLREGPSGSGDPVLHKLRFSPAEGAGAPGEQGFVLELAPEHCGKLEYRIRAHPNHPMLTHPFELGLMIWV
jgi:starch phosphorylase